MSGASKPHSEQVRLVRACLGADVGLPIPGDSEALAIFDGLVEQLETLRTNAIRRFQVIYNESDIDRMKLLAYDGIAEATGNEWRDVLSKRGVPSEDR